MFTGIIEELGSVEQLRPGRDSAVLTVQAQKVLEGTKIGDSIAVNGICLTVTDISDGRFSADVMHETLRRSSLAGLKRSDLVNLERAVPAGGRLGGHIVAGHVDGTGKIICIRRDGPAVWYTIQAESSLLRFIVEKGSVAVDGISLTVARVEAGRFSISAIPHTVLQTSLHRRAEGDLVNLETDIIGKYIEKLLSPLPRREAGSAITMDFLAQHGF